jgi:hypothetical protein
MVTRRRAILAAALLAAAAGLWWFLRAPPPEEQIEAQLAALCRLVGKKAGEGALQMASKVHSLPSVFADPVEIRGDAGPVAGRHTPGELASLILRVRAAADTIDLGYTDLAVELQPPDEAAVRFTCRLRVTGNPAGGGGGDAYREVAGRLRRVEGRWVFSQFNVVNVMKGQ